MANVSQYWIDEVTPERFQIKFKTGDGKEIALHFDVEQLETLRDDINEALGEGEEDE